MATRPSQSLVVVYICDEVQACGNKCMPYPISICRLHSFLQLFNKINCLATWSDFEDEIFFKGESNETGAALWLKLTIKYF